MKTSIKDINVQDKVIFVRVDFNVPIKGGKVTDTSRIEAALPTLKYLLKEGGKLVLFSHLDRVKTLEDRTEYTLEIVAPVLEELLGQEVMFSKTNRGEEFEKEIKALKSGEVLLAENTRHLDVDDQGREVKLESDNDSNLAQYWASLADVYVNDAFGTAHRAHASTAGIAAYMDVSAIGFLVENELEALERFTHNPENPVVVMIGGAKISDKLPVILNLLTFADKILIGGGMAYTFYKAQGLEIGDSIFEEDFLDEAQKLMDEYADKLELPCDIRVGDAKREPSIVEVVSYNEIPAELGGYDIGDETIAHYKDILSQAKTIIWNGPFGVTRTPEYSKGTNEIVKYISKLEEAQILIGGGDTGEAVHDLGLEDKMTHVSTGGGATLTYLEGKELVGLSPIK